MSVTPLGRRSRRMALVLVAALTSVFALAIAGPSQASNPAGSLVQLFTESPTFTANPTNAIQQGWWGHEGGAGPAGSGPTYLSLAGVDSSGQITDASQAALLATLGTDSFDNIGYAIVPYTANGANERPLVSAGENAAQAFSWVVNGASGWGPSLNGSAASNDSVTVVSTLAQLTDWVGAGRPLEGFDNSLVLHDLADPANPVSAHPKGSSILDAWPAGTQLSLVAYVTNGFDASLDNEVPIVAADNTGHAKTAWMPFTTVGSPTSALRTSAGYDVMGAYAPSVTRTQSFSATGATLTGTVKTNGNTTATDATGNLEFAPVVNGVRGSSTAVPTANGVATLSIPGFTSGSRQYDVRYVPDTAGQVNYVTTDWFRTTMTAPVATTTSLAITGGTTDTFTATVTPGAAGHVTFKNGTTVIGTVTVTSGKAKLVKLLTAGKHVITATFTPTSSSYKGSAASKTIWQPTISAKMSPLRVVHGTRPKVIVKVIATGATVSGRVTITYDPPTGATRTFTVTLRAGSATLLLPRVPKGATKLTIRYLGNSQILAGVKVLNFRAV